MPHLVVGSHIWVWTIKIDRATQPFFKFDRTTWRILKIDRPHPMDKEHGLFLKLQQATWGRKLLVTCDKANSDDGQGTEPYP